MTLGTPGPGCPQPASARPSPRSPPGTAAGAFRLPHERFIFVGVAAPLWRPQDLVSSPLQTCPFPSRFAGGWERSGKLETSEHHSTVPSASSLCGAREAAAEDREQEGGVLGCGENLPGKPSCDLLRLPPDGSASKPVGSLCLQLLTRWPFVCLGGGGGGR